MTVTLSREGPDYAWDDNRSGSGWSKFEHAEVVDDYLPVRYAKAANGLVIPISAIASREAADAFVRAANGFLVAKRHDLSSRIRATLAESALACATCKSSVRGPTSPRCPECGTPFNTTTPMIWKALQPPWWRLFKTFLIDNASPVGRK
jgi:hypothetical protein